MRHDVAETVELTYTTRPPMPGDIAFVHRMNEIVKEEASVRTRKFVERQQVFSEQSGIKARWLSG